MTNIISIDQSFSCSGICIFSSDGNLIYFDCIKSDKSSTITERISYVTIKLLELYEKYECSDMVCERLSFGSFGNATRDLAALLGTLEVKMYEKYNFTELSKVSPTAVKKFATGSGKAKKKDMMDALPEEIYHDFYNAGFLRSKGLADLADAYFIGKMHMENNRKMAIITNELLN